MKQILIIEDDIVMRELLRDFLMEAGYEIALAADGVEGCAKFINGRFDLVLLDVLLPKVDGYEVCGLIRRESQTPVIMLTALGSESDQIKGLDLKADDYIVKPFSVPILLRKIAVLLRRSESTQDGKAFIHYKDLSLDLDGYRAYMGRTEILLTRREFEVLRELLINKGKVLTRKNLLNKLWRYDFYGDERAVDTHIKNLRKKLGVDFIDTIRGVGYRIDIG